MELAFFGPMIFLIGGGTKTYDHSRIGFSDTMVYVFLGGIAMSLGGLGLFFVGLAAI